MRWLPGVVLLVLGTALAVVAARLVLAAGVVADRDRTGGGVDPVLIVLMLLGVGAALAGLHRLFRCYERWRDSR
ncbi:hypothetical protein [Rathayibacter sp. VKM Ac-2760]|uniref:hypothetical protein n=1 Tax=Rathayibacter sp. VKM Ac-2760 TaxID=2609253 RepID=UPI0013179C91|nr:hypothetical protein [Rathayibacter sp. VKM Ac-2760]QHC58877.1 hypothetical protein GSU72_10200 [Rathayibacter sp. VKM Ac-2760]